MANKTNHNQHGLIAKNKKAFHDYTIESRYEAGIVLSGWEIKSIRQGRVQLVESHVRVRNGEVWLINGLITPLTSASTHVVPQPTRTRKLLLNKREINKLMGKIDQQGYTIIPLAFYWKGPLVKVEIGLAKGKQKHDKRQAEKAKDWQRQKSRIMRHQQR